MKELVKRIFGKIGKGECGEEAQNILWQLNDKKNGGSILMKAFEQALIKEMSFNLEQTKCPSCKQVIPVIQKETRRHNTYETYNFIKKTIRIDDEEFVFLICPHCNAIIASFKTGTTYF